MLLYYITDRSQFSGDEVARRRKLLEKIAEAADCRVDFVQLRERDLTIRELELLARDAVRVIRENSPRVESNDKVATRLLINSRTDVAIACGMDGVHLRSDDVSPGTIGEVWKHNLAPGRANAIVSVACHTLAEVGAAAGNGADFALFGPVFEKRSAEARSSNIHPSPTGLASVREACGQKLPLIALGGITLENARACPDAGAVGIAGIRIFQENKIKQVVGRLRS